MVFHMYICPRMFISTPVHLLTAPSSPFLSLFSETRAPVHTLLGNRTCVHIVYVCVSAGAMIFPISLVVSEIVGYISACETEEEE